MSTVKDRIIEITQTQDPRTFSSTIRRDPILQAYVNGIIDICGSQKLSEALWCIANSCTPKRCACGEIASFKTFNAGYRTYCSLSCPAKGSAHGEVISKVWKDPAKVESMMETKNSTMIDKYGVTSSMLNPESKRKCMETKAKKKLIQSTTTGITA